MPEVLKLKWLLLKLADVSIINVKERGFDWDESCGLILQCSWYTEYGTTAIPSQQDTEEQEKAVVKNGKELIAKFCSQCAQAEVSQWISFSRPQYIGDLTCCTLAVTLFSYIMKWTYWWCRYSNTICTILKLWDVWFPRSWEGLLLRTLPYVPQVFVERVGVCVCYAEYGVRYRLLVQERLWKAMLALGLLMKETVSVLI